MKVLFLDIDGVLNYAGIRGCRAPSGIIGVDNIRIRRLAKIVSETNCKIVLCSTWKKGWEKKINDCDMDARYLIDELKKEGLEIFDKTKNEDRSESGTGIRQFLIENDVEKYVIIDNTDFSNYKENGLEGHLVITDNTLGLRDSDVDKCIKILS